MGAAQLALLRLDGHACREESKIEMFVRRYVEEDLI